MPPLRKLTKERLLAWVTQLEERATASEIARRTGHPKEEIERLAAEWKIRLAPDRAGLGTPAGPRALTVGSDPPNSTDSREGPGTLAPEEYLEQQSLLADAEAIGAEMKMPLAKEDADRISSSDLFRLKRLSRQVASTGPGWPLPRLRLVVSDMTGGAHYLPFGPSSYRGEARTSPRHRSTPQVRGGAARERNAATDRGETPGRPTRPRLLGARFHRGMKSNRPRRVTSPSRLDDSGRISFRAASITTAPKTPTAPGPKPLGGSAPSSPRSRR